MADVSQANRAKGRLVSVHFSITLIADTPAWLLIWSSGIKDIYLIGFGLDYCVKYSAPDARQLELNMHVIIDGCRGSELSARRHQPGPR
ncbi:MAG: hypothetical protein DME65_03210 [Verrucomicrobia bacterium]|nr:MAG: hypothetical protein DME65_03210 [Verrucomicrobiota bacterium]